MLTRQPSTLCPSLQRRLALFLVALATVLVAACDRGPRARLLDYRELGELRVATRSDPLAYRIGPDGAAAGFEHDLLIELGRRLGVRVRFTVLPTTARTLDAIERGDVHLAAASLLRNDERKVVWSSPVRPVEYVVVGREGGPPTASDEDFANRRIGVRRGSVPAQRLQAMRRQIEGLTLDFPSHGGEAELLERVAAGSLDFAATEAMSYQVMSKYHPELRVAKSFELKSDTAWAIAPDSAPDLLPEVEAFLADARESGLFDRVAERYFGHVQRIGDQHVAGFLERMRTRLPKYRDFFVDAARKHGLDWRLVAAVAYQESQWDPNAVSRTGVRGMMMLTVETAERLGVRNRLDPRESIEGGARYLAMLRDELPAEVTEPDRTWMAVAAYNVGMGHLRGAGAIARSLAKDDSSWMDMKRVLPLISRPAYAARLRSGAGRGGEAVIMAESVRNYYDILARYEPATRDETASRPPQRDRKGG